VYNIVFGGREYFIDIYYVLIAAFGKDIEFKFGFDRKGDIKYSNVDIFKVERLLGYHPEYDFKTGLAEAIQWYRENL